MSFSGDLEHLSIVDVVQLVHSSRKSGTLTLRGHRGECQLVFSDGFVVSANHPDNQVRIGRILVDAKVITEENLDQALQAQRNAGADRRPLVALLIESGRVTRDMAYKGLGTLVMMTIVEVMTWKVGTFSLDPGTVLVTDEFRYFPEHLQQSVAFDTQFILMDAVRIYDEKKRSGLIKDEEPGEAEPVRTADAGEAGGGAISADDLGLGDVESLERKIPDVYLGLQDQGPGAPAVRRAELPTSDLTEKERLALRTFLEKLPPHAETEERVTLTIILLSPDQLMTHCINTVCKSEGLNVFATNEEGDLDLILGQFIGRQSVPVLLIDAPQADEAGFEPESLTSLRGRMREQYPHLCVIQFAPAPHVEGLCPEPEEAITAILNRPVRVAGGAGFVEATVRFLRSLPTRILDYAHGHASWVAVSLQKSFLALREHKEPQEIAQALLGIVAETFPRVLNLMFRTGELVGEQGIGLEAQTGREPRRVSGMRIPLAPQSLLEEVVRTGRCHLGRPDDPALEEWLYARIGAPLHPQILLLPLQVGGRTIAVTYADSGVGAPVATSLELWQILADQSSLVLESSIYRKRLEKPSA